MQHLNFSLLFIICVGSAETKAGESILSPTFRRFDFSILSAFEVDLLIPT